ncbi:MAG: GyrI-like domain-containing protein [Flavobacteriales bacterium]|nr:GyrI-like domain-containing protein [Flavobacteriales bacterium]
MKSEIVARIVKCEPKKLVGLSVTMSLVNNLTGQLWGRMGPEIKTIVDRASDDKISLQVYPSDYYLAFNPAREFEKWALVEVTSSDQVSEYLKTFELEGGLYAVFDYKGSSNDPSILQYIFSQWIPQSEYAVDDRPHFEVLGANYRNNDPKSEEEIWIPIKARS